ncbi:hypothetical protein TREES_T100019748 [Tupaia chinensis]|uniref:Uncharacterized protein n=1 Tax=Tupaia chinensis TaxID=246437 RepID=L9JEA8_TUPCH|nr:hypothetical protein TREES_T100019748 [Tupaia chinensis]
MTKPRVQVLLEKSEYQKAPESILLCLKVGSLREESGRQRTPVPSQPRLQPQEPRAQSADAETSLFPALAARLAPPPPPPSAGTASTAQPNRPLLHRLLVHAAPPTASKVGEPFEPPSLIGHRARAYVNAGSYWTSRSDISPAAPPRSSNCCCLAGRQEREERGYSDW